MVQAGPVKLSFTNIYLINYVFGEEQVAIPVAWTGIAAMLLKCGRTVHSRFKIPISLNETSVSSISASSKEANVIRNAKIIIWNEAPMAPAQALRVVDVLLKDLCCNDIPFGGKVIVLGGDLRLVFPVVPHGSRNSTVKHCLKSSPLWRSFPWTRNCV